MVGCSRRIPDGPEVGTRDGRDTVGQDGAAVGKGRLVIIHQPAPSPTKQSTALSLSRRYKTGRHRFLFLNHPKDPSYCRFPYLDQNLVRLRFLILIVVDFTINAPKQTVIVTIVVKVSALEQHNYRNITVNLAIIPILGHISTANSQLRSLYFCSVTPPVESPTKQSTTIASKLAQVGFGSAPNYIHRHCFLQRNRHCRSTKL